MKRERKILSKIDKEKPGVEIGPSHAPVAPRRAGYDVKIIDHLDREALKQIARDATMINEFSLVHSIAAPTAQIKQIQENQEYFDSHAWSFTRKGEGFMEPKLEALKTIKAELSL